MTAYALDISFLYTDIGFGTYTDGLLRALLRNDKGSLWHLLANDLPRELPTFSAIDKNRESKDFVFPEGVTCVSTTIKRRLVWASTFLPRYLKEHSLDLFHSVDNISLPLFSRPCPYVLTVHDIIPLLFPDTVERKNALAFRVLFPMALRRADRIVCVSEATRSDLHRFFPAVADKTVTIYNGIDRDRFCPLHNKERLSALADLQIRYGIQAEYCLVVASLSPRRNVDRLICAFHRFIRENDNKEQQLVIAGVSDYRSEHLQERIQQLGIGDRVLFLGHVPRADLPALYQCASCTICVSLYEGFGFPVAESLACGTPVVASNSSSLPEVGGESAIYVDPYDAGDIARGIREGLLEDSKTARLARVEQAKRFDWDEAAKKLLRVYRECINGRNK